MVVPAAPRRGGRALHGALIDVCIMRNSLNV
jgi:hypothetical protein